MQNKIMERVAAGREEIDREREAADRLARDINAEVEALILGAKKVSELRAAQIQASEKIGRFERKQ